MLPFKHDYAGNDPVDKSTRSSLAIYTGEFMNKKFSLLILGVFLVLGCFGAQSDAHAQSRNSTPGCVLEPYYVCVLHIHRGDFLYQENDHWYAVEGDSYTTTGPSIAAAKADATDLCARNYYSVPLAGHQNDSHPPNAFDACTEISHRDGRWDCDRAARAVCP